MAMWGTKHQMLQVPRARLGSIKKCLMAAPGYPDFMGYWTGDGPSRFKASLCGNLHGCSSTWGRINPNYRNLWVGMLLGHTNRSNTQKKIRHLPGGQEEQADLFLHAWHIRIHEETMLIYVNLFFSICPYISAACPSEARTTLWRRALRRASQRASETCWRICRIPETFERGLGKSQQIFATHTRQAYAGLWRLAVGTRHDMRRYLQLESAWNRWNRNVCLSQGLLCTNFIISSGSDIDSCHRNWPLTGTRV